MIAKDLLNEVNIEALADIRQVQIEDWERSCTKRSVYGAYGRVRRNAQDADAGSGSIRG